MNFALQFKDQIESFLSASKMPPTEFGRMSVNDPNFVFDLRAGRNCTLEIVQRVLLFMQQFEQQASDGVEHVLQ